MEWMRQSQKDIILDCEEQGEMQKVLIMKLLKRLNLEWQETITPHE